MSTLKTLELSAKGTTATLSDVLDALPYNDQGLITAIAQDHVSKDVLMLAWMNRTAIETTLNDGFATYYSRSRQTLWRKGETSGHLQKVISMHFDCDGDALLLQVAQEGPACHTNRSTCFYLRVADSQVIVDQDFQKTE